MKFHSHRGVLLFLIIPYLLFVTLFEITGRLEVAQNILIIPVFYALWVILSLYKAIKFKYRGSFRSKHAREEILVLFFSLTPWVGLPIITYFNLSQPIEAVTTNTGFLLLLGLHLKRSVEQIKYEHRMLTESEQYLRTWNERLQEEVEKRTKELDRMNASERLTRNCKQYHLTIRESEIVCLICRGNSHKQIAECLFIAERTVAKHVQNIFEKVRVSNRMELHNKMTT
jgi:DNA-binding CsgD family transcriptional regulator